jgi:hypothetical protein
MKTSWAVELYRHASGRRARRLYFALVLLLVLFSGCLRVRSFLLTRRIHAVLSGLAQVRVDQTTEEQLLKTVPYLVRSGGDKREGASVERVYFVQISNGELGPAMPWVPQFLYELWPQRAGPGQMGRPEFATQSGLRARLAPPVIYRYCDGSGWSGVEDLVRHRAGCFLGWPASYFVVAHSVHGFWAYRRQPVPVHSTDDQSPEYRFGSVAGEFSVLAGADSKIGVAYTSDAPRELVAHAFQVDLSCFWNIRGCASVRQVVPLLWADKQAIVTSTAARLASAHPCPDSLLAARVRYLPDLNVALLEAVRSRSEEVNREGDRSQETITDYRLKDVIRGRDDGQWTGIHYRPTIPSLFPPTIEMPNPIGRSNPKPGDLFLHFSGAYFDSCRVVPATPSAESAVRTAVPAPRRKEDEVAWTCGGRQ